jgi:hypothetical protein
MAVMPSSATTQGPPSSDAGRCLGREVNTLVYRLALAGFTAEDVAAAAKSFCAGVRARLRGSARDPPIPQASTPPPTIKTCKGGKPARERRLAKRRQEREEAAAQQVRELQARAEAVQREPKPLSDSEMYASCIKTLHEVEYKALCRAQLLPSHYRSDKEEFVLRFLQQNPAYPGRSGRLTDDVFQAALLTFYYPCTDQDDDDANEYNDDARSNRTALAQLLNFGRPKNVEKPRVQPQPRKFLKPRK